MPKVEVDTLQHDQTGKVHIVQLTLGSLRHCYCSLNRDREPKEEQVELTDSEVCETCVKGFLDASSDDDLEEKVTQKTNIEQVRGVLSD